MLSVLYAKCRKETRHAECHYAACHYAGCYYAECRGARGTSQEREKAMAFA
jgi:hypothetical protein